MVGRKAYQVCSPPSYDHDRPMEAAACGFTVRTSSRGRMNKEQIAILIRKNIWLDRYEEEGVDDIAQVIAAYIQSLEDRIIELEEKNGSD